jgi:exodeoxyribonuclease VII large subunit
MSRLPFKEPEVPGATRSTDAPLSVSQLAGKIKNVIHAGLPGKVRVVGEVSNFSGRRAGGHWFFSLKDDKAALRCVCFASAAQKVKFNVADGLSVIATGRVDFYDAQGNVQLYVDALEPAGQGALELALRQLIEDLRAQGYFDPEAKLPLPAMPQHIAVVTSASGAALQDVINTTRKRWAGCRLSLVDVRVQGESAAPQIARAIRALSKQGPALGIEAIILTRGGGSIEDLWAFNDRKVADAIFKCRIPIVAAIGHETDTTVAELVADLRCATPTQAAMALVPESASLEHQLSRDAQRLALHLRRQIEHGRQRVTAAARHALFRRPRQLVEAAGEHVDRLHKALITSAQQRLREQGRAVDALARQLEAVGPRNVLSRGYSYTLGPKGEVLRSVGDVGSGDRLTTVLVDGQVRSVVDGQATPVRHTRRTKGDSADQARLF